MPKDKRKRRAASRTRHVLRTRQMLYHLSHQGSSAGQAESLDVIQGQRCLFLDKQGNSYYTAKESNATYMHTCEYPNVKCVSCSQLEVNIYKNMSCL